MTSSIWGFKVFWCVYPVILVMLTLLVYNWEKCQKEAPAQLYIATLLCSIYLCLGIFSCGLLIPEKLELAEEYEAYKQEEIIPIQTIYKNAQIPDGYYYLGVELIDCQEYISEGEIYYIYSFGTVGYEHDAVYQWETMDVLDFNIPYLLVMDSLATEDITDDQITVIWGLVS